MGVEDPRDKAFVLEVMIDEGSLVFRHCVKVAPRNDAVMQKMESRVRLLLWQQKSVKQKTTAGGRRTVDWYRLWCLESLLRDLQSSGLVRELPTARQLWDC